MCLRKNLVQPSQAKTAFKISASRLERYYFSHNRVSFLRWLLLPCPELTSAVGIFIGKTSCVSFIGETLILPEWLVLTDNLDSECQYSLLKSLSLVNAAGLSCVWSKRCVSLSALIPAIPFAKSSSGNCGAFCNVGSFEVSLDGL